MAQVIGTPEHLPRGDESSPQLRSPGPSPQPSSEEIPHLLKALIDGSATRHAMIRDDLRTLAKHIDGHFANMAAARGAWLNEQDSGQASNSKKLGLLNQAEADGLSRKLQHDLSCHLQENFDLHTQHILGHQAAWLHSIKDASRQPETSMPSRREDNSNLLLEIQALRTDFAKHSAASSYANTPMKDDAAPQPRHSATARFDDFRAEDFVDADTLKMVARQIATSRTDRDDTVTPRLATEQVLQCLHGKRFSQQSVGVSEQSTREHTNSDSFWPLHGEVTEEKKLPEETAALKQIAERVAAEVQELRTDFGACNKGVLEVKQVLKDHLVETQQVEEKLDNQSAIIAQERRNSLSNASQQSRQDGMTHYGSSFSGSRGSEVTPFPPLTWCATSLAEVALNDLQRLTCHRCFEFTMQSAITEEMLYSSHGWAQRIARSELFINATLLVVVLNSIYIGLDADLNDKANVYDSPWPFIILDNLFSAFFVFELFVRAKAFYTITYAIFQSSWFRFDTALVAMMVLETWVLQPLFYGLDFSGFDGAAVMPLRLLRLLRLTRLAKFVRAVPELVTMTHGLVQGVRACIASIGMIVVLIYIFGIILHSMMKENKDANATVRQTMGAMCDFSDLSNSMWLLLVNGTFLLDGTGTILTALLHSEEFSASAASLVFLVFIFLSAMVVCNMLIGVLCEVVSRVAQADRDDKDIKKVVDTIQAHLELFDDGNGLISREELSEVMNDARSQQTLDILNVDRVFMLALHKMFYQSEDTHIPISGIKELMLMCRADTPATVHTIANCICCVNARLNEVEANILEVLTLNGGKGVKFAKQRMSSLPRPRPTVPSEERASW